MLQNAINWCNSYGLYFDAHNENLPELIELFGNDSRKIGADYYCDDKNYWLQPEREQNMKEIFSRVIKFVNANRIRNVENGLNVRSK